MSFKEISSMPVREISAFNLRSLLNSIALVSFIIGGYLEAHQMPGSDILLLLGMVTLLITLVFMVQDMRAAGETGPVRYLTAGTLLLWIISATFKGFHWPFANVLVGATIIISIITLIPVIFKRNAITMPRQLIISFFLFLLYLTGMMDGWLVFG